MIQKAWKEEAVSHVFNSASFAAKGKLAQYF